VIAGSAEEAAEAIRNGFRPTIVLLDINLPGDSGWGFLRGRHPRRGRLSAGLRRQRHGGAAGAPARVRLCRLPAQALRRATLVEIVERHHSEADDADASVPQGGPDAL
jgi:hypothetical protein